MTDQSQLSGDIKRVKQQGQKEINALAFEAPDSSAQFKPQSNNINVFLFYSSIVQSSVPYPQIQTCILYYEY